jgi:hypothetical protein
VEGDEKGGMRVEKKQEGDPVDCKVRCKLTSYVWRRASKDSFGICTFNGTHCCVDWTCLLLSAIGRG